MSITGYSAWILRTHRQLLCFVTVILSVGVLSGCAAREDLFRLNPGAYQENYIKLIDEDAPFLIHPTGNFPRKPPNRRVDSTYRPEVVDTDNMDQKTLELLEQGYVMIGYAAVNTREKAEAVCDKGTMTKAEYNSCRFWKPWEGINPDADRLGDPLDNALILNAELVAVQRDYAFSRMETAAKRIVTSDGRDRARTSAGSSFSNQTDHYGQSVQDGWSNTDSSNQQNSVGGSIGMMGSMPTADVNAGTTWGNAKSNTQWGQNGVDASTTRSSGGDSSASRSDMRSQHWATALVENTVDHYDYVATFWKRIRPQQMILGVFTDPLPQDYWNAVGSRAARVVRAVVGETPAYHAEIWEGDVIVAIDGERIRGEKGLRDELESHAGQEVTITVFRQGEFFDLPVHLGVGTAVTSR